LQVIAAVIPHSTIAASFGAAKRGGAMWVRIAFAIVLLLSPVAALLQSETPIALLIGELRPPARSCTTRVAEHCAH